MKNWINIFTIEKLFFAFFYFVRSCTAPNMRKIEFVKREG